MEVSKTKGYCSIHRGHVYRVWIRPIREIWMIPLTRIIGVRVRVIGQSRFKLLNLISVIRVLDKRTPNLTIQRYMLN